MKNLHKLLSLLYLGIILLLAQPIRARNFLVCVGLSDYPQGVRSLRVSANDAKVVSGIYSKNGDAEYTLITNRDASCEAVLNGVRSTFASALSQDVVVFYFSGHGTKEGLACYDGVLSFEKIIEAMKQSKATSKVIVADACFSGKMRNNKAWKEAANNEKVMLFLSSRSGETSRETRYSNSLFTIYFERGLRGGADTNRDRIITARELYDFVHKGVIKDSKGGQHPVMWGQFDGNMPIIKWSHNNMKDNGTNN